MDPEQGARSPLHTDHSLVKQYQGGNQEAANELYARYAGRLQGLAKAELSPSLGRHVEVDDIVQSVFGSFFRGVNQTLYDVPAGEDLWKLLLVMALHKIRNKGKHHRAAKRDMRRVVEGDPVAAFAQSVTEQDTAAQAFLKLVIDEALGGMSEAQRQAMKLRMEGFEVLEIARNMGRSRRTVERLLQQGRTDLAELLEES